MDPTTRQPLIAAIQHESHAGVIEWNLDRMRDALDEAMDAGVDLAVLPECGVQGYGYDSADDVERDAVTLDDPLFMRVRDEIATRGLHAVVGFVERDGDQVFNSSAVIDPAGEVLGSYRKLHLPGLGVDRFVATGDREPPVVDTTAGRVGLLICADMIFPEAARVAALKGADIIAISACVPHPMTFYADSLVRVRAYENCTYVVFADMVGQDGAWGYDGRSQIAGPGGTVLAQAPHETAAVISVAVDLAEARTKVRVRPPRGGIPHAYEVDFFGRRQPALYGRIASSDPSTDVHQLDTTTAATGGSTT
jgi:predicted amidohydrolase